MGHVEGEVPREAHPEGSRLVGPDPDPAVVLPELLELYGAHGLQSSL